MIKRRTFVAFCAGIAASFLAMSHPRQNSSTAVDKSSNYVGPPRPAPVLKTPLPEEKYSAQVKNRFPDDIIVDNIPNHEPAKVPESPPEIILNDAEKRTFESVLSRLSRLQRYVGYGNFNIISWDQSLRMARKNNGVGSFVRAELDFIEALFATDARSLGFYGDKVVTGLSSSIPKKEIRKIPATGHYLFKGDAADTYKKIRDDIGDSIILTSGVRSVVKQIYLFLNKAERVNGNLSLASYSLAPPGHSYHAVGDFDVGRKGFGGKNFTEEFTTTDEFKRLSDLGYLDIRYPQNNPFGVRYEPWHIKVV